jgi:hypothetical protein
MRANRCLPALALFLFFPARADEGAVKAPPQGDVKPAEAKKEVKMSCCAGEEGADKALCPKAKSQTTAASKKNAVKKTSAGTAAAAAAPAPLPAGAANMVVTKDPETGELRNATAAEREQLVGRRPLAAPEHKVVKLPDGSVMVELGESDASYAVATRNPDGTVSETCVHGDASAAKAASSPGTTSAPAKPADR